MSPLPSLRTGHALLGIAFVVLGLLSPAAAQAPTGAPDLVEVERRAADGERCIVCGKVMRDGSIVELRYKGRSIHVAPDMLEALLEAPDTHFHKMQARSALFDEETHATPFGSAWLWFGIYVLAGLVCAALCGYLAISRALSPLPWFFAGLVGNVAAVVVVLLAGRGNAATAPAGIPPGFAKVATTRAPVPCASCGRWNHPSADRCAGCEATLTPAVASEVTGARSGGKN